MQDKNLIIEIIMQNNPRIKREILMPLSIESLMMIQSQTELEFLNDK